MKCQAKRVGEQTQQDVRFGLVDKKRRHVGVIVFRNEVELVSVAQDASYWQTIDLPPGKAFYFCVKPARNGETFGSSAACGYTATAEEQERCIAKAVAASRKRYEKQFPAAR